MTFHVQFPPERQRECIRHVLDEVAKGRALGRVLTEDANLPSVTEWYRWESEIDGLRDEVTHARELGAATLLDEIVDIADDSTSDLRVEYSQDGTPRAKADGDVIARAKLRIYAREKYAQMIAPRRFGPKVDVTSGGEKLEPSNVQLSETRITSILAIAAQRAAKHEEDLKRIME